jgi:hypothetical protein
MIYDKYRGKNTGPQCVNISIPMVVNVDLTAQPIYSHAGKSWYILDMTVSGAWMFLEK